MNWIQLTQISQLKEIQSSTSKSVIFKHSTRCSISRFVLKNFENEAKPLENIQYYFLDLLAYRELSNTVAEVFQVHHESPQLLVIENGSCVYHASHDAIEFESLEQFA
jgi:bacillithiol system protein YtxJ